MPEKVLEFNPFSPHFQENPYPTYHRLRAEDPVHQVKGFRFDQWFLTRFVDVQGVLNDPRFRVDDLPDRLESKAAHLQQGNFKPLTQTIGKWLFFLEPPDHTRLRSLVSKAFSSGKIEQMRPRIQAIVNDLIDQVQATAQTDIIAALAAPLPALVSSEILGIPGSERGQLVQWAYDLFHVFDQPLALKDYEHINQVAAEFKAYFTDLIHQFRSNPQDSSISQDSLISKLVALQIQENRLSEDELLAFLTMLFSVGQETTENLIGNSIFSLINCPEEMVRLKQDPALIFGAVEELLRYDAPVQIISRTAIETVEIDTKVIRRGDKVNLLLGAANRDPARFEQPDRLDLTRKDMQKLPFGSGIHYCLGAELARIQAQVAINTVVQRLQDLRLAPAQPERRKNIVLRGFKVLQVNYSLS